MTIGKKIIIGYIVSLAGLSVAGMASIASVMDVGLLDVEMLKMFIVPALIAVAFTVGFYFYIQKFVHQPILNLTDCIHQVTGEGGKPDLKVKCNISGNDEVGGAATAFNEMMLSFNGVVMQMKEAADHLAMAADQYSGMVEQTRAAATSQDNQTSQALTGMREMTATIQEVAQNASEAASAAHDGISNAQEGQKVVQQAISAIRGLSGEVDQAVGVIGKLESDSEQIGNILSVITGIAQQTNLLALNAAIEAARAGEQGRGFAVVADEVRTLAQRTQNSTQEISDMISQVQEGTRNAVDVMQQSQESVRSSVSHVENLGTTLTTIVGAVQRITDMTNQIASAAEEQSAVSGEINRNVDMIQDGMGEIVSVSQEAAQSTEELALKAKQLQSMVAEFQV